jgi:hypothetical protein
VTCFACGGPFHPASGHVWPNGAEYCGPCIRHFFDWAKRHAAGRRKGADFYAEAATSIRAGVFPTQGQSIVPASGLTTHVPG